MIFQSLSIGVQSRGGELDQKEQCDHSGNIFHLKHNRLVITFALGFETPNYEQVMELVPAGLCSRELKSGTWNNLTQTLINLCSIFLISSRHN